MDGVGGNAWLVGLFDAPLRALLEDVFSDLGIRLSNQRLGQPRLILVATGRYDLSQFLATCETARDVGVPLLAILPFRDDQLAKIAEMAGADEVWPLGTPLDDLTGKVRALVARSVS